MTYFLTGLPIPKLLNELLSLFVGIQVRKRATFFRRNDVNGIICEPINGHSQEVDESPLLRHSVVQNRHEAVLLREEWLRAKQRKQQRSGTLCEVKERHARTLVIRKDSRSSI